MSPKPVSREFALEWQFNGLATPRSCGLPLIRSVTPVRIRALRYHRNVHTRAREAFQALLDGRQTGRRLLPKKCASSEGWHEQWVRVPPG